MDYSKLKHREIYEQYGYVLQWDAIRKRSLVLRPVTEELKKAN